MYEGGGRFSGLEYFLHGSLCFSTVLPAVYSVYRLLYSKNRSHEFFYLGPRMPFLTDRIFAGCCFVFGVAGMFAVGAWPQFAYPFLWFGPVLIYGGLCGLSRPASTMVRWARGDWRWVGFWSLAALICGFFWEMWNVFSLLRWEYHLSCFNGLHVFEMPVLGYLGYLPFGVFCGLVTRWIFPREASMEFSPK